MTSRAAFGLIALQMWSTQDPTVSRPLPAADSARVVRMARSAQASFETFRRNRLPIGYGFSGPCDIRIGRYCYWRGDETEVDPPPEPTDIGKRRDALIRTLDSAAHVLAGDGWIAGQHVRYLVEAGRADEAARFAATDCRAGASWCAALTGYAAHVGGRFAAADSAFAAALASMETAERCRWIDVSHLLDDELAKRFKALDCDARDSLARRLFWLGAPLFSVVTTDLRTEHFARLTRARIGERAATIDGESWADDQRELVLRYGWPRWYSRSMPQYGSLARPSITGHDAGVPYSFLPSFRGVDSIGRIGEDDWRLDDPLARTGYAPSYAKTIHAVPSQVALFRRGDSVAAVAAWDARRDTTLLGRELDAALVLASPDGAQSMSRASGAKTAGRLVVVGRLDSGVVSLELLAAADRRAARVRLGVPPRAVNRVSLSDLLFYGPDTAPAYSLAAVQDSALTSMVLPATRPTGVYWETYGLKPGSEPVHFTLTVERVGVSWIRQVAERLRFADPSSALRIQWQEVPLLENGIAGRGVRVDLSRLRAGRYRVEVSVSTGDDAKALAFREIEIR
jgi:hypothetical protein